MIRDEAPILTKTVNALIAGVEPSDQLKGALGWRLGPVENQAQLYGGFWVGGDLTLFPSHLQFLPNALNRLTNTGDLDIDVPLAAITDVFWRRGLITSIVDVLYSGARVSFRCYGSKALTLAIQGAVSAVHTRT